MEMPEKYGQSGKSRRNNNVWGGYGRLKDVMYKLAIFGVMLTSISYSSTLLVNASYNAGKKRFLHSLHSRHCVLTSFMIFFFRASSRIWADS